MVNFDIIMVDVDVSSIREQLAGHLHPAVRVLVRLDRSARWIQVNLDSSKVENRCWKFSGILSHTVYLNQTTFYQESEIKGRFAFSHGFGTLTIL